MNLFNIRKDQVFFDLLDKQAEAALQASKLFHSLVKDYHRLDEYAMKIDEIEHTADDYSHQLGNKADSSFITPLDKEDLHSLSAAIDDVTDSIEAISDTLVIYRLHDLRTDVEPLAALLVQMLEIVVEIVSGLREMKGREELQPLFIKINQMENKGDDAHRKAIASMFHSPARDPFLFVAWKEVYDRVEASINHGEKVANLIERLAVKYA